MSKNPTATKRKDARRRLRQLVLDRPTFWPLALFWIVPILGLALCWKFQAPHVFWEIAFVAAIAGLFWHFADVTQFFRRKKELEGQQKPKFEEAKDPTEPADRS